MTDVETIDAIVNGNGIADIEFCNNGAWVIFTDYVEKYYKEWFYVEDCSDTYVCAKSIVAWRMHTAWSIASNNNNIALIVIKFAKLMHDAMRSWASATNLNMCYEIAVNDMCLAFVNQFGLTYSA